MAERVSQAVTGARGGGPKTSSFTRLKKAQQRTLCRYILSDDPSQKERYKDILAERDDKLWRMHLRLRAEVNIVENEEKKEG